MDKKQSKTCKHLEMKPVVVLGEDKKLPVCRKFNMVVHCNGEASMCIPIMPEVMKMIADLGQIMVMQNLATIILKEELTYGKYRLLAIEEGESVAQITFDGFLKKYDPMNNRITLDLIDSMVVTQAKYLINQGVPLKRYNEIQKDMRDILGADILKDLENEIMETVKGIEKEVKKRNTKEQEDVGHYIG